MKRLLALFFVFALFLCFLPTAQANVVFGDKADIVNTEAAAMLTSLGIIQGFPDGKFRPAEDVTRAQLAKMIYYILNGIKDKSEDHAAMYTGTEFTDVKGHWASGYIYFCYRKGIIAGYTDGSFRPDQNVTATEACKMLLVSLGYKPSSYIGSQWSSNTITDARAAGITNNYDFSMSSTLDRDNAALFIYNALFAEMIAGGAPAGTTLLQVGYGAQKRTVTVVSNEIGSLDGSLCPVGYTRVRALDGQGETFLIEESSSVDRLGHAYVVYIRSSEEAGIWTLYGNFFSSDTDITLVDTDPELDYYDIVGNGKAFMGLAADAAFYVNYYAPVDQTQFVSLLSAHPDWEVIYISDDGDALLDRAILLNTWLCQIESLGSAGVVFYNRTGSVLTENVIYAGKLAADAFYNVTQVGSKYLFEDTTQLTASISEFEAGASITVGSNKYSLSSATSYVSTQSAIFIPATALASSTYVGVALTFIINSNGLVGGAYRLSAENTNYALLLSCSSIPYSTAGVTETIASQVVSVLLDGASSVTTYRVFLEGEDLYSANLEQKEPGLYTYMAINGDGTIYGLEPAGAAVASGTQISITNGNSTISGLSPYLADEDTVFYFWTGNTADTPVSYTGIYKVPTVSLTAAEDVHVWYAVRNNVLEAVYITLADPGTSGGYGYVYIFNSIPTIATEYDGSGALVTVYTYEGFSGGSKIRLKTKQDSVGMGLFAFTSSGGISTLYTMGTSNCIKTQIRDIYSGFIYLYGGSSPSSIHNWAEAEIYVVNVYAQTMTPSSTLMTDTDVIIVYNRTGDNTADAAYIFLGNGIQFGTLGS